VWRRGSGKGIMDCAGDWSHLIQTRKVTSSFIKIKDIHPGFENRDYILHFKEDDEEQKCERNSWRKR
jgi:hypothetical protein